MNDRLVNWFQKRGEEKRMFRIKAVGFIGFMLWALAGFAPVVEAGFAPPPISLVALVIGNDDYQLGPRLPSSRNDAKAMAEALEALGFAVTGPLFDLTKAEMDHALRAFREQHRIAAAVVYFSGAGVQVHGRDYLLPVDARLRNAHDVALETVALNSVLDELPPALRYRLVIVDARWTVSDPTSRIISPVQTEIAKPATSPTYLAFAARRGQEAAQAGKEHSPFTAALLKYLRNYRQEQLPLERLFGAVRDDVLSATERKQGPVFVGEFTKEPVYLME